MEVNLNIQWYPGHMTKARRMMEESVRFVDAVCEIVDARIPRSSRNPDLNTLVGSKPRLVILNRADQADPALTRRWSDWFRSQGLSVLETDCKTGRGTVRFQTSVRALLHEQIEQWKAKGQEGRTIRVMVAGIPNVGKSTFINRVAGRKAAAVSDRPGVTRGRQWITIGSGLELLDTPGILWPKFDSPEVGENLAFTGAVNDEILDREQLAADLMTRLAEFYPGRLEERYQITPKPDTSGSALLEAAAKKRGFLIVGGGLDTERMAIVFLDEFRGGKLGRITLEVPPENGAV